MPSNEKMTYFLARLPIGMSFFGHGLVRMPKIHEFAENMAASFKPTWLSENLVMYFAAVLPFIELFIGIFLLAGLFVRISSIAGVLLMVILIFGSCLIENWNAVAIQLFYGVYFTALYRYSDYNIYALDKLKKSKNYGKD